MKKKPPAYKNLAFASYSKPWNACATIENSQKHSYVVFSSFVYMTSGEGTSAKVQPEEGEKTFKQRRRTSQVSGRMDARFNPLPGARSPVTQV
jgi:hypothetical protein